MRRISCLLVALFAAALVAAPAEAQLTIVRGKAVDAQGSPVAGATVEWHSPDTGRRITVKTNRRGEYVHAGIPFGNYNVTVTKDGKVLTSLEGVPVQPGENEIDFDLAKTAPAAAVPADPTELTPEQKERLPEEARKQLEQYEKEKATVKQLNDILAQAGEAQRTGDHEQAVQLLNRAVKIDPKRDLLWARLGEASMSAKQYDPAVEAYQRAISLAEAAGKPAGAYHNNMGQALLQAGRIDDAMQAYSRAAQVDPTNAAQYFFNLGAVLTNAGRADEANAAFDKALAADPTRADAHYWKGVNLIGKATLKGDKMVAPPGTAEAFNRYLELQPNGQYADAARGLLESIGAKVETEVGRPRRR